MARTNKSEVRELENRIEPENSTSGTEDRPNETTTTEETGNSGNTTRSSSGNEETELNPPKRQRGRPKGSTNKNKETISLQEEERLNSKNYSSKKSARFLTKEEAQKTTEFILSTVNDLAVNFIDKEAALNPIETSLLAMSLPEYLSSIELSKLEQGSRILYPIMAIAGISLYGLRVSSIVIEKRKQEKLNKQKLRPFEENNTEVQTEPEPINNYPVESEPEWTAANLNKQNISKNLHPF